MRLNPASSQALANAPTPESRILIIEDKLIKYQITTKAILLLCCMVTCVHLLKSHNHCKADALNSTVYGRTSLERG